LASGKQVRIAGNRSRQGFMKLLKFLVFVLKDYAHFSDKILEMASIGLSYEDWLEGASNFLPWKARIMFLLEENRPWSHVNTIVIASTYPVELTKHEAKEAKAMWMILDLVRDHLVPHLSEKKLSNAMFSILAILF